MTNVVLEVTFKLSASSGMELQMFKELQKGKSGGKSTGNVGMADDTPVDDEIYEFESRGSSSSSKPDAGIISAVVKEVTKAFSGGSNSRGPNQPKKLLVFLYVFI